MLSRRRMVEKEALIGETFFRNYGNLHDNHLGWIMVIEVVTL